MEVVSSNIAHGELTKFVSDLRQVAGFLLIRQFPPPIKLTANDIHCVTEILLGSNKLNNP